MFKIWIQPVLQFKNANSIKTETCYDKAYCNKCNENKSVLSNFCDKCGTKLEKTESNFLEYIDNVLYDEFEFLYNREGYIMENIEHNIFNITQIEEIPYILNKIDEEFFKENANIESYFNTDEWKKIIEFFNKHNIPFEKKIEIHIETDNKKVEYEKFIDDCYFDYWVVRPVGDKYFNSPNAKHFMTEKEADDYMNKMMEG